MTNKIKKGSQNQMPGRWCRWVKLTQCKMTGRGTVCESEKVCLTIGTPFISITQEWRPSKTRFFYFLRKTGHLNFYLSPNICKCGQPLPFFILYWLNVTFCKSVSKLQFKYKISSGSFLLGDVEGYEDSPLNPEGYISSCRTVGIRKKGRRNLGGREVSSSKPLNLYLEKACLLSRLVFRSRSCIFGLVKLVCRRKESYSRAWF